jgi:oligopeptidase A
MQLADFVTVRNEKKKRRRRSQKISFICTMKQVMPLVRLMFLGSVAVRAFSRSSTVRSFYRTSAVSMTTASVTTINPLLQQDGLPRFAEIEPKDLTPAVEDLLQQLEHDFQELETKLSASTDNIEYEAVLPQVERMQFPIGYTWGVAGHLNAVKNGDELREAYQANQPKIVKALTQFKQSQPVFAALSAIAEKQKVEDDSFYAQQKKRAVEHSLRSMKLGGVGLEGEAKETFNNMKMRLAELATKFSNNVLDETKAFSLTLTDASQMDGVPDSAKAMWANAHVNFVKQNGEEKDVELDVEKGPWRITLDMPSYIAVMSHMKDRTVREQVYKAYLQRASSDERNNTPFIYETLKLKNSMAKLLGFDNYAEQSLSSKMAPSVEAVRELTDLIAAKALPAAEKELTEITALAREKGGDEYSELKHWDVTYWSERLKESKFELTEEETRPYFALPAVLDGMFQLVSRIFDIEVQSADGEEQVWHPDVRFFKVFDKESGKHIASFFLDPYSRPENKRGGAWMNVCIGKSEACNRDTPVAYLTCNGSPPVGTKPSLMTFREVTTLFHEFGHGLQHMLTTATVGDVAGISGVEWDAVELPSQFMENW